MRGTDKADLPHKSCIHCGRPFAWRKKWARTWDEVRYCSDACRGRKTPVDGALEEAILGLLRERAAGASICPSEVARLAGGASWRERMPDVRAAAARLVARGLAVVTQGDESVDPNLARGPIRIRATGQVP